MELTIEQSSELQRHPDRPLELIDPRTRRRYVLISEESLAELRDDSEDRRHMSAWMAAGQQGLASALGDGP